MSGKKAKKSKGTTVSLQEFNQRLEDTKVSTGQNIVYAAKKPMSSWADEVENDDSYMFTAVEKIVLPSAPRASRGPAYDDSEIPRQAPYIAHIGNLAYDIGEDDVYKFFRDLQIVELRLPRDSQNNNRLRGFGYVEFDTRQDLINALIQNEQMLKGRQVRVNLGTNQQNRNDNDRRGGGGGYGQQDNTPDDWRTAPKTEFENPPPSSMGSMGSMERLDRRDDGPRERRGYGDRPPRPDNRYRDNRSDYGDRDRDRGGYRGGSFEEEEGPSDWRRAPRQEFQQHRPQYSHQPSFERRPPSEERPERPPRSESPKEPEVPRERPKLNLKPRTVDLPPGTTAPEANAAIFGGAKPVDTAAREREIEEKLAQMSVQSREPSPPPQHERERRDTGSSRDSQRDRSRDEPQYRILQRPSSERTLSGGDAGDPVGSPTTSDYEPSNKSSSGPGRRFQTTSSSPRSSPAEGKPPPRVIQLRSGDTNRERLVSTSSLSSRGSNPDTQSYTSQQQVVNGQRAQHYPVPPAPGSASRRHKSDSDEGDREDDRSSRHERQTRSNDAPAPSSNVWTRRPAADHDTYRSRESVGPSDRKTPDSEDRNGEKEKDSHSEPEDDRDAHPYIAEKSYEREHQQHNEDYRRVERRDFNRDRDLDRHGGDSYNRRGGGGDRDGGSWQRGGGVGGGSSNRRSDMGPRRGGGGFQDDRRGGGGGRDDHRDRFRDDRDRDRGFRGDDRRDRDHDFRDRRSNMDNRDRDYRSGGGGMNRGGMDRGGSGSYDRRAGGGGQGPRRGGPGGPPPLDKGPRRTNRDELYRDSEGFETSTRGQGRERPMPKHSEDKPPVVTSVNKFQTLGDEQCD